jgi:hypothetical protein
MDWGKEKVFQVSANARLGIQNLGDSLTVAQTELIICKLEKMARENRIRADISWNVIDTSVRWTGEGAIEQSETTIMWLMVRNLRAFEITLGQTLREFEVPSLFEQPSERVSRRLNCGKMLEWSNAGAKWILGELVAARGQVTAPLSDDAGDLPVAEELKSRLDTQPQCGNPTVPWHEFGCPFCDF